MVVLPAPVGPTMATFWPGWTIAAEIVDDGFFRRVAELDVGKRDLTV